MSSDSAEHSYEIKRVRPGETPSSLGTYESMAEVRRAIVAELTRNGFFQVIQEGRDGRRVFYPWLDVRLNAESER